MFARKSGLIAFLAQNCLVGVLTGWAILAMLIALDVASLRSLLLGSEQWLLVLIMAAAGFGLTFGSLAMGTAVFMLPKDYEQARGQKR